MSPTDLSPGLQAPCLSRAATPASQEQEMAGARTNDQEQEVQVFKDVCMTQPHHENEFENCTLLA